MRKYLPAVLLLIIIFGSAAFRLGKEVVAGISRKADIDKNIDQTTELWFKNFSDKIASKSKEKIDIKLTEVVAPVVIVNFWASWCGPCLKELPALVQLRKNYSESNLYILGINGDEAGSEKEFNQTLENYHVNFPNILDPEHKHLGAINSDSFPITLVFNRGKIIFSSFKQTDFLQDSFLKIIDDVLQAKESDK